MFCSLIPNASKLKIGVLIAFLVIGIATAYFLIPAIAGADTDVTPPENTAQIVSASHVVSPSTTNVEFTTHEITPLTFPAEQFEGSSDLTWLYTGVVIGLILITAIGLVIFLRRKTRRALTPLLIFLLGLAILTAIPTAAFAQTLNITTWANPTGSFSPQTSVESMDASGSIWFINQEGPDTIGYLNPATNEFFMWLLPIEGGGYMQPVVDSIGCVWFYKTNCWSIGGPYLCLGRLNPATNLFTVWPASRAMDQFLTADTTGNIWYPTLDNEIACLNPITNTITVYTLTIANIDLRGISADTSGNIWFSWDADTGVAGEPIAKLNPSTGTITEWPIPNNHVRIEQVHVVAQNVYFSDSRNLLVGRLNSVTNEITQWSVAPTGGYSTSITADTLGNMWITIYNVADQEHYIAHLAIDNILRWWEIDNFIYQPTVDVDGNAFIAARITSSDPIQIHRLQY